LILEVLVEIRDQLLFRDLLLWLFFGLFGWRGMRQVFKDKFESIGGLWERISFLASFWASISKDFVGVTLFLIKSDWMSVCKV